MQTKVEVRACPASFVKHVEVWAELFNSLPEPQSDYPPLDERRAGPRRKPQLCCCFFCAGHGARSPKTWNGPGRPFPERFTDDFFRDRLPELEFRLEEAGPRADAKRRVRSDASLRSLLSLQRKPGLAASHCLTEARHASRAASRRRILENVPACAIWHETFPRLFLVMSMTHHDTASESSCCGGFALEVSCEVHDLILKGANKNAPLDKELKTPPLDTSNDKFSRRTSIFSMQG